MTNKELAQKIRKFAEEIEGENELKAALYYISGAVINKDHKQIMITTIITIGLKLHDDLLRRVGNLN
jgi:hypothetical protein